MMEGDASVLGSDTEETGIPSVEEVLNEIEDIHLTPTEHQRVKDLVNGDLLKQVKDHGRRYLVVGAGGETGAATRRHLVYNRLNERADAIAIKLEDFGLTPEDIKIWSRVFDILCGMATHIVAIIEDFAGGYVWELGLLFSPSYREKTWVLKRRYLAEETERERYDNGMAISHVKLLLTGSRAYEWVDADELQKVVEKIP